MTTIVPIITEQLRDDDPLQDAIDDITWAQNLAINLLTKPKPRWWTELGLPDDIADVANLNAFVRKSADTLSKLREIKKAASCQNATHEAAKASNPSQIKA